MKRASLIRATSTKALHKAWGRIRPTLRDQIARDAVDWLDFDSSIAQQVQLLRRGLREHTYLPVHGNDMRAAKGPGFSRSIRELPPAEMLVYRALVDELYLAMREHEHPSVYFSRSRRQPQKVVSESRVYFDDTKYESWAEVWVRLQQARAKTGLAPGTQYMVVTDLSGYFDSIHHAPLRDVLTPYVTDPDYLRVLMFLLEAFANRVAYEPQVFVGIPQDDVDCSRVLGHLFLFFIDEHIANSTAFEFARWMDDITISCRSLTEARSILFELQQACETRHLRLNEGKTRILEKREISEYYYLPENQKCDQIAGALRSPIAKARANGRRRLKNHVRRHLRRRNHGHWEKVLRRLATLDCTAGTYYLLPHLPALLIPYPKLADKAAAYIAASRGANLPFIRRVCTYLSGPECFYDDVKIRLLRALGAAVLSAAGVRTALKTVRPLAYSSGAPSVVREALLVIAKLGDGRDFRRMGNHFKFALPDLDASVLRVLFLISWSIRDARLAALSVLLRAFPSPPLRELVNLLDLAGQRGNRKLVKRLGSPPHILGGAAVIDTRRLLLLRGLRKSSDSGTGQSASTKATRWLAACPQDAAAARLLA